MKPKNITLILLSIIICLLLIILSFEQSNELFPKLRQQNVAEPAEKCTDTTSRCASQKDFTIISMSKSKQQLRGKIIHEQGVKLAQFLAVPYAENHVRFRKATPPRAWSGVRDATFWPPLCMQNKLEQYEYLTSSLNSSLSEHCLYLNIWSPHRDLFRHANRANQIQSADSLLPVILFIPGGGFNYMGSSYKAFYGGVVAALGKVVIVTISYRLGVFGFLRQPSSSFHHSNIGLLDQIAAIEYVNTHIHSFGGNAASITLQGQSAGAISIGLLMLSPLSNRLFQRVILQSASPMMPKQLFEGQHYDRLMDITNCTQFALESEIEFNEGDNEEKRSGESGNSSTYLNDLEIQCLENMPATVLNNIQAAMVEENAFSFGPAIPSPLFPDFPLEFLKQVSKISKKSILLGANQNEASLYMHQVFPDIFPLISNLNLSVPHIELTIKRLVNGNPISERQFSRILFDLFAQKNITTNEQMLKQFLVFLSDFTFKGPVLKFAKTWSETSNSDQVFLYLFNQSESHYPSWVGSSHWIEMDFVFGIPLQEKERFSKEEQELSSRMIQTWTHFAKTGEMMSQLGLGWPSFSPATGTHMVLQSSTASLGSNLDMEYYSLFELLYETS